MFKRLVTTIAVLALLFVIGCKGEQQQGATATARATAKESKGDVHSYAKPDDVVVNHVSLDLEADFEAKRLIGTASLTIENKTGADKLHLDTRDLTIKSVTLGEEKADTAYALGDDDAYMGKSLVIDITPETNVVHIEYETSPDAAAVQWLSPEQTAGKKHPFLFTQSQAILARTWVPCQDSPGVRITYDATIKVPKDLLALMSAENPTEKNDTGVYTFNMPQAIPSYLLALSIGDLEFRALGENSGVYAEPSVVAKAAKEMEDTPAMITAAEGLYGPYRWGRYDILILPPSFPYGGMENPRLTFATPTILAGDKSLVALVAHELAHSWSGNLVTNATWNDFWLNEGFTTYFEKRIMEAVYGREYSEMLSLLSFQDLQDEVESIGADNADTHLFLDLDGRDPDDGMTSIAYDKGYHLLRLIEETVGRETFDTFLRNWFDGHAFQSATTTIFIDYLDKELLSLNDEWKTAVNLDAWIFGPGIPDNVRTAQSTRFEAVDAQLEALGSGTAAKELDTDDWTTQEWRRFIRGLPETTTATMMSDLDLAFAFTNSGNSEVLSQWLIQSIRHEYTPANPAVENFLTSMGRRKFLAPIYTELAKTEEGKEFGRAIYEKARPTYHSVSTGTIDEILDWESE